VLGQRHLEQDHESGAIAMLLAILVGTGALFALTALALDAGRQFVTHNQVQQAADSTVQAVVSKCRYTSCPTSAVMSSMLNTALASSTAQVVQACWDAGTGPETCINNAGSLVSRDSALFTSVCQTLRDYDGNPITPGGTAPYFQIVVQTRTPLSTLFNPGPAQHFRACGQGVWWTGRTYAVPKVLLFPACAYGTHSHTLAQDASSAAQPTRTGCTLSSIDFGPFTLSPTTSWITEIGNMTSDTTCDADQTNLLYEGQVVASSSRVLEKAGGECSSEDIADLFNLNPSHSLLVALGGPEVVDPANSKQGLVQVVAFAQFTLIKWFDGNNGCWRNASDRSEKCPSTAVSAPADAPSFLNGKAGKFGLYGYFSDAEPKGQGGGSPGYAVRP
jgi:Flp pilus assembly protein TadG